MKGSSGYAVFFYPQALEALGDAIKPYLQDGQAGPHVVCREIDTAGAFVEMTMSALTQEGQEVTLDLLVPSGMVRMVVSSQQAGSFGFRPHAQTAGVGSASPAGAKTGDEAGVPAA
ncbi:hypothetical protein [Luteimonas sp. SDU82]|uniref:hypothetical protein n=1 Tax=Luteimonas sp. SDU82 TaxID=3422592 RepID=UPI003EB7FE4F